MSKKPPLKNGQQAGNQIHQQQRKTASSFKTKKLLAEPIAFENLGKKGQLKNDEEIKVEKALIELNEMKNDITIIEQQPKVVEPDLKTANSVRNGQTFTSTFFNNSASNFFKKEGSILGNIDNMTPDQLKERLMVAETLMKKLYERNKDLEAYHKQKVNRPQSAMQQKTDGEEETADDQNDDLEIISQFKQREEQLNQELALKQTELEELRKENMKLTKENMSSADPKDSRYTKFLENRIKECTEENKRYLTKYADLRNFTYTQIESLIKKQQIAQKTGIQRRNLMGQNSIS